MKKLKRAGLGIAFLPVVCGMGGCQADSISPPPSAPASVREPAQAHQVFIADLQPLNSDWSYYKVSGVATLMLEDDTFTADVRVGGVGPSMAHLVLIRAGSECPTSQSDLNGDGVIDETEGTSSYGPILMTLNEGFRNAWDGMPVADGNGVLGLHASTSYNDLLTPLRQSVSVPYTGIGTEALSLESRTVVIYGVVSETTPVGMATLGTLAPSASIPIACGKFKVAGTDGNSPIWGTVPPAPVPSPSPSPSHAAG